jgi:hypothetical protein
MANIREWRQTEAYVAAHKEFSLEGTNKEKNGLESDLDYLTRYTLR